MIVLIYVVKPHPLYDIIPETIATLYSMQNIKLMDQPVGFLLMAA